MTRGNGNALTSSNPIDDIGGRKIAENIQGGAGCGFGSKDAGDIDVENEAFSRGLSGQNAGIIEFELAEMKRVCRPAGRCGKSLLKYGQAASCNLSGL